VYYGVFLFDLVAVLINGPLFYTLSYRVNGLLAISRAFGDTQFKPDREESDAPAEGLVISRPEVYSEVITPKTEFAVMATDGLWDVMTPQMSVTFVKNMLHKHRDLEEAAKALSREALARGSVDNVTVLIMSFHFSDEGKIKSSKEK
jgi:serine/threonine protein phosphatase PrpC